MKRGFQICILLHIIIPVCFFSSIKEFVNKVNDWLIKTYSFLIGEFILILNHDWRRNSWMLIYEAKSTPKIELLLRRTESRIAESVFVWPNHNSCHRIKFMIFLSFRRIGFRSVDLYLDQRFSFKRNRSFLSSCLSGLAFSKFCSVSHVFWFELPF